MIEDNPGDARLVHVALAEHVPGAIAITCTERLDDALSLMQSECYDVVLFDLDLVAADRKLTQFDAVASRLAY